MPRHRPLLLTAAVCLLAGPFALRLAMTPEPGVTRENFRRLAKGMTLAEIEEIMGERSDAGGELLPGKSYSWTGKTGDVVVVMSPEGRAESGTFYLRRYTGRIRLIRDMDIGDCFLAKIRRWLGMS